MESVSALLFGIYILFFSSICSSKSEQICPPPDFPEKGDYSPRLTKFQPGDSITYRCEEYYTLVGKDESKCKSDGEWSHPTPFCDLKAILKNPYAMLKNGRQQESRQVTDGNRSTCFPLDQGEKIVVNLEKQKVVYAVRLLIRGRTNIEISIGRNRCGDKYAKYLETNQWVMINCKENTELTNTVTIQDKSDNRNISAICEIEVYVKEEDGCENPPMKKIPNGYFEVSRSKARLICVEGYKSDFNRLVCEGNEWKGQKLLCEEILCNPKLNVTKQPGSDWTFLEPVKKISAGTKRQLKCSTGYKRIGHPDVIECQKDGSWTKTTAACIEIEKSNVNTQTIIYASVGIIVTLIVIVLLGAIIFFVRKQRDRQVVVIYKSSTDGSVRSGSDAGSTPYYETINSNTTYSEIPPLPIPQILSDGYAMPLDGRDTVRKKTMPADIAFSSFKQSSLYGS